MSALAEATLRIDLLVRSLHGGGMERVVSSLAEAFADRGHGVRLLVAVPTGATLSQLSGRVRLVRLARSAPLRARAWAWQAGRGGRRDLWPLLVGPAPRMLSRLPALVRILRQEPSDVLLAAGTQSNLVALWARRLGGIPMGIVVSEHNTLSIVVARRGRHAFRRAYPALAGDAYPEADAVVAVSDGVAEDLSRATGIPRSGIQRIHNPIVSPALLAKSKLAPPHAWLTPGGGPPVLLGAGRLHRQKDYPTLLRAFARVRATRPARLVILGEGPERRRLERLSRQLGVAVDVALPGFAANPYAWMARSAAFALSSAWEGLPGVLIEAMACGCPVVSTDCPSGPAEILGHGAFGPLVPVGDWQALAHAISSLLEKPPDADRLRARAAAFSVDASADRYLEVLAAAARRARGEPLRSSASTAPGHA